MKGRLNWLFRNPSDGWVENPGSSCQKTFLLPIKRMKKCFWFTALVSCCYLAINYYLDYSFRFWNPQHPNYFIDAMEFKSMGFTVNTPKCKILNLSAWDRSIIAFVHPSSPRVDCYKTYKHWTYVSGSNIILNVTAMRESGYSMDSVDCCYRVISRVEQTIDAYDSMADAVSKVSDVCEPLKEVTNPLAVEFVRVKCIAKYWPAFRDVVYRNYHTLAQPNRSLETFEKISYWRNRSNSSVKIPPNVLILGIDSMSRLNFARTMNKTKTYLQQLGAVELFGYAKVGENTYPNSVAFLAGYNEDEIKEICYPTQYTAQDSCPYIWKRFNAANYLTGHLEDMPGLQMLNRLRTGFVKQQVDFYMRPFMLDLFGPIYEKDCIGPDTQEEKVFDYINGILNISLEKNVPAFVFTWITNLAHRDLNAAHYSDNSCENFLRQLDLSNTILFFISDHGFRYGAFRETFAGWFEDKLPNFWVYLPPSLRSKYHHWQRALEVNSRRLTSPFDMYHTLNHIIEEFSDIPKNEDFVISINGQIKTFPRQIGQSLFKDVPEARKCSDAGIQNHFCPCSAPRTLLLDDPKLVQAAEVSVDFINNLLPSQCSKLKVAKITAGGLLGEIEKNEGNEKQKQLGMSYIVAFVTDPGRFLFEATVEYNTTMRKLQVTGNVLRMNKITTDVSCAHDVEIEKLCYC